MGGNKERWQEMILEYKGYDLVYPPDQTVENNHTMRFVMAVPKGKKVFYELYQLYNNEMMERAIENIKYRIDEEEQCQKEKDTEEKEVKVEGRLQK